MKTILKFLVVYSLLVGVIVFFYDSKNSVYEQKISMLDKQVQGVTYLKNLYVLSIAYAKYMSDTQDSRELLEKPLMKVKIDESIQNIYELQKIFPNLKSEEFNKKLEKIKALNMPRDEYYDFLDFINHEYYVIGDKTTLLFEEDRELYFLISLVTHYIPEYLISTFLSHNIIEKYKYQTMITEKEKNIFIQRSKLINLSITEVTVISKLLARYSDVKDLRELIATVRSKVIKLQTLNEAIYTWKYNENSLNKYLTQIHEVSALSNALNKETFLVLEHHIQHKQETLLDEISIYKLNMGFLFFVVSMLMYFVYKLYILNIKKSFEIKEMGNILDQYVPFSKTDIGGYITYVGQAMEDLTGYTKEELIGNTHSLVKNNAMDPLVYDELWETILNKEVYVGEILNQTKDGTPYWVEVTIIPNLDKKGEIVSFSTYRVDITNRKALEVEKLKNQAKTVELLAVNKALEKLSRLDTLTQIPNRFNLDTAMQIRYDMYQRHKKVFSVILIDIDYFKSVNDTFGHLVGDEVLKSVANLIGSNIRDTDFLGSWGGEEFMIICEETDSEGAYNLAEKIRLSIQNNEFNLIGYKTISLGIAEIEENIAINDLIKKADDALFYAKNNGRNKTIEYKTIVLKSQA